jgi:small subunit ribosomal protein S20
MPHTRSAEKRLRQNEKRRMRNRATMKALKVQMKTLLDAVKNGSTETLQAEFKAAVKKLDKAAARRVVHPNLAARKKSQIARLVATKK